MIMKVRQEFTKSVLSFLQLSGIKKLIRQV